MICAQKAGEQLPALLNPLCLTQIYTEESLCFSKPNAAEVMQAEPLCVFCLW